MNIKDFIEECIPQMDSPEKVYQLFDGLGYRILDTSYKGREAWGLREKDREIVEEIYTVASYTKRFQIFLVKLKTFSSSIIRKLPLYFERETQYPFFVLTPDWQNYTFVLVEKIREDVGVWKRKLIKLNLDIMNAFYTDKWILSEIAIKDDIEDPVKIYGLLKEAFGVQKVTKKFFAEYKENFDLLADSLSKNNKGISLFDEQENLYGFAQRFLGRLMFLYFLQKKGWLAGDVKFIPNQFERSKKENKNFYQYVLEPLFFNTLNRKRPNDESKFGKIPFLNGGLFEKDYNEFIYIPDKTTEKILDFLNSYNFTISEELPLEVEVAVNPEMLGRIFESMLPEYERGKKGTFYTPRPIVHFMCRESLKNFLCCSCDIARYKIVSLIEKTETKNLTEKEAKRLYDALTIVRILDPAVGSGAFLVSMMQEIIRLKISLSKKLKINISPAQLKREIIKSNLYGIDIESEAIEIAKLRLWLSLVVDEELTKVEPLPNLDYKLAVGNSLVESFKGRKLIEKEEYKQLLLEDEIQKLIEEFRKLKDKLLDEMDPEKKNQLRAKLKDIEWQLIEHRLKSESELKVKQAIEVGAKYSKYSRVRMEMPASEKKKMERLIEEASQASDFLEKIKKTRSKPFFLPQVHFAEVFTEKGGFDIVIANPPYVRTQKLSDLPYRKDLKLHYGYVDDLYVHFTFRSFELARQKGVITFITSDTYLTLTLKERMRELLQNHHIRRLILTPKAFKATVNTAIFIVQKEKLSDYNLTFIDAREIGGNENENWEDKLIIFEELKEIESYDTQIPVRLGNRELEVSYNRYADVGQFRVPLELYKKAVKRVFFPPTEKNLRLYEKFMPKMNELYEKWWNKIKSSKDIQKNKEEIEEYLMTLKPGDITLLGLITEGGQGLATADNSKFLAVLEGTEEAKKIEERLYDFEKRWRRNEPEIFKTYQELLGRFPRNDVLDKLRQKYDKEKLNFPRGFIYKIIKKDDIFDVASYLDTVYTDIKDIMRRVIIYGGIPETNTDIINLWKLPKLPSDLKRLDKEVKEKIESQYRNLINEGKWVNFIRGAEAEGKYWYIIDRYIDWSRNSVRFLQSSSRARWQSYEFYFKEGITYMHASGLYIKSRLLTTGVYDHNMHSFFPDEKNTSVKYLLAVSNSKLSSFIARQFLNHSVAFELNDIRLLPIIIPTESQLEEIEPLVDYAIEIQKRRYASDNEDEKSLLWQKLQEVQKEIDEKVEKIYSI